MPDPRFQCPGCKAFDTLYEDVEIPGWRALDDTLKPAGDRDALWEDAVAAGTIGCSCGWQGSRSGLEALGTDGEPLPLIHPGQQTLEAA